MNPLLETRVYNAEFLDREAIKINTNTAAESILHNCDADGNEFMIFKSIMDYNSIDKYVKKSYGYIHCKNRSPESRKTTKSW